MLFSREVSRSRRYRLIRSGRFQGEDNSNECDINVERIALAPDSFDVYVTLVRVILALKASGSDQSVPPAPADLSAEQHFTLGILFASRGANRDAVSHFKETLQM